MDADNGDGMRYRLMVRLLFKEAESDLWRELSVWVSTPMHESALDSFDQACT